MRIAGVVLAAGEGRRFGGRKQLAELWGRPLAAHAVRAAREVEALERVFVVVGAWGEEVASVVRAEGGEPVWCADWAQGNVASLRCGLEAAAGFDGVVVTLADQPLVGTAAIARLAALAPNVPLVARATYDGQPGHPVLLRRAVFDELRATRSTDALRALLRSVGTVPVPADELARPDDVDTPADLERIARLDAAARPAGAAGCGLPPS